MRTGREREGDALLLGQRAARLDTLGCDSAQVDGADLQGQLPGLDLGKEEEVTDERE